MSRDEVKSLIKFPNYGQENPAHKVSQEQEVKMVWDPYQVEILGISILVKRRENCQTKEKLVFLDEFKWGEGTTQTQILHLAEK